MEKGQVLWTQVVGDEEFLHFVGQRQGLPGSVQKGAVIPAAPGVLEGLTVPGDELKNLFRAGQAALDHGIGPGPLQVAPVFIGDGEDVGQGEPLPQVKIHHMLFAADHLDSAGAQLGEGGVDEISAECR